jgi:hypothetical protein
MAISQHFSTDLCQIELFFTVSVNTEIEQQNLRYVFLLSTQCEYGEQIISIRSSCIFTDHVCFWIKQIRFCLFFTLIYIKNEYANEIFSIRSS